MLDKILETYRQSQYDFRDLTCPEDPLQHLFSDWVPYYRLKWAIAQVLQPRSILEIGVRYGYSARVFLEAVPDAKFVGIDLDSDQFGGVKGAIDWATKLLAPYDIALIVSDSQQMTRFPGDIYDLIHVDGQQDGDGSFHDLRLAIAQGRYILVDGYHWTRQNYMAVNDFLLQHRELLDWYGTIPGYAGELLIKVAQPQAGKPQAGKPQVGKLQHSSLDLRDTYTQAYYTQDCGGYEAFTQTQGRRLEDPRLRSVAALATLTPPCRVLDLGCGRGELAYFLAQRGYEVTAIDYSGDAIALAEGVFRNTEASRRVTFHCASVCDLELPSGQYDLAIASDLIEHLSPQEVQQLYQNVRQWLTPQGQFILHSFPNRWYYQYDYPRRRRQALALGAWMPVDARSRYERLMHINEQSPRVLRQQLRGMFGQVELWFGDVGQPGGSLVRPYRMREMAAAPSLYAVASQSPIPIQSLRQQLWMQPVKFRRGQLSLKILEAPIQIEAQQSFEIQVELTNHSPNTLSAYGPNPINFAYRWFGNNFGNNYARAIVREGQRTPLFPPLKGKPKRLLRSPDKLGYATMQFFMRVQSPSESGPHRLHITLVQEGVQWLDQGVDLFAEMAVEVVA
jgi:2-polyprenyl-3-methyl-5-hydroxy-6-metoxy-1,4-benzoquinol methylase